MTAAQPVVVIPEQKLVAVQNKQSGILLILSVPSAEADFLMSYLNIKFREEITPMLFNEINDRPANLDPICIIVSPPLETTVDTIEKTHRLLAQQFPKAAIIWLIPDVNINPSQISKENIIYSEIRILFVPSLLEAIRKALNAA